MNYPEFTGFFGINADKVIFCVPFSFRTQMILIEQIFTDCFLIGGYPLLSCPFL